MDAFCKTLISRYTDPRTRLKLSITSGQFRRCNNFIPLLSRWAHADPKRWMTMYMVACHCGALNIAKYALTNSNISYANMGLLEAAHAKQTAFLLNLIPICLYTHRWIDTKDVMDIFMLAIRTNNVKLVHGLRSYIAAPTFLLDTELLINKAHKSGNVQILREILGISGIGRINPPVMDTLKTSDALKYSCKKGHREMITFILNYFMQTRMSLYSEYVNNLIHIFGKYGYIDLLYPFVTFHKCESGSQYSYEYDSHTAEESDTDRRAELATFEFDEWSMRR